MLEELYQKAWVGSRQNYLRPFSAHLDVEDVGTDSVSLPIPLARDLLFLRQDRVGAPEIHDDVLLLETLYDSRVRQLAFAVLEFVVDDVPLGVSQTLFWNSVQESLTATGTLLPKEIYVGLFKALVFGIAVSTVSCAAGLRAAGGALGVGLAVQGAVRNSVILIIVLGFITTWFFYFLTE